MIHRLVLPNYLPPTVNQWAGRHWAVKHKKRLELENLIAGYRILQDVTEATGKRKVRLLLSGPRQRDADAHDKALLDALVRCKLLIDDSPEWLDGRVEVSWVNGVRNTEIVLEDVP